MASPRPYLAFELDALDAAAGVANALQIKPGDIAWGLLQLWRNCWRQKRDVVSDTSLQMAFGPDPRVGAVLKEAGFVEPTEDGQWRVCGAGRYLRVSKARSDAGKVRAAKAKRDAAGRLLGDLLDDEDTNSSKLPAPGQQTASGQPALAASSEQRAAVAAAGQKKRKTTAAGDFVGWAEGRRLGRHGPETVPAKFRRDHWAEVSEMLGKVGRQGAEAAWLQFEGDRYAAAELTPVLLFLSQWPQWVERARAKTAAKAQEASCEIL